MTATHRSQKQLLLIAIFFLTPFIAAVVMRFGGWEPPRTRNHGELLAPPLSMEAVVANRVDGSTWVWENVDRQWSLLLQLPTRCDDACRESAELLVNVRQALGRHAEKLHMFEIDEAGVFPRLSLEGELPAPLGELPSAGPQVWLVDPHGYLVMRYREGYDPSGVRRDLSRLVK